MVDGVPVGYFGEERTWVASVRVEEKSVNHDADDLGCRSARLANREKESH